MSALAAEALAQETARKPLFERFAATERGPELTVIVPTRNERNNILPLYHLLCETLRDVNFEIMVVDDDSRDGTVDVVQFLAKHDRRVRLLSRIGRRGLASAYVEAAQASTAPYIAVIDADMQHDETLLPKMLETLQNEPVDVVVGSRYVDQGGIGNWDQSRARISALATRIGRKLLRVPVNDPMSGFFMLHRDAFAQAVRGLSAVGFKILVDILASSPEPLRVKELPYEFRNRHFGESKFDTAVGLEYLMLLTDKLIGHVVPIRFLMFVAVGGLGVVTHLAVLAAALNLFSVPFSLAQSLATGIAMIGNFVLNNMLTYRDKRLTGWRFFTGLLSFCAICSVGAVANVGIASVLFADHAMWWLAGLAGAAMSAVWNYALTSALTWRN